LPRAAKPWYRAVHVIVENSGKLIEVQVRTSLQHLWAEVSEKLSGVVDASIKYGSGDHEILSILNVMSQKISDQELAEAAHLRIMDSDDDEDELFREGPRFAELMAGRLAIVRMLEAIREVVPRMKGRDQ
jgi:ppGpp synthetase/RelA/SpoT-type nucleotidyltranferase